MMNGGLKYLTLIFLAASVAGGELAKTDFHSLSSILASIGTIAAGLAGLCMHPPWTRPQPGTAPSQEVTHS